MGKGVTFVQCMVKKGLAKGRDCIPKGLEYVQEVCRIGLGDNNSGEGG